MADKRISQLVERTDIANNDVVPIVASGATTTNKATISSIQEFMQENLDLGVTSVGITLGSSGTDVSVTGSPITTSGNITINFPTASATNRGLLSSADWITFSDQRVPYTGATGNVDLGGFLLNASKLVANGVSSVSQSGSLLLKQLTNEANNTLGYTTISVSGSNSINFGVNQDASNSKNFSLSTTSITSNVARTYTLPDASGTLALASQLDGYVTLDTTQSITATKSFITGGGGNTLTVSQTSGSGIALNITKFGNGEGLKVEKFSGTGNAMTVIGGNFEAPTIVRTGGTSTQYLMADGSVSTLTNPVTGTGAQGRVAYWDSTGVIKSDSLFQWDDTFKRLGIGRTPTVSLAVQGAAVISNEIKLESTAGNGLRIYGSSGTNQWDMHLSGTSLRFSDNTGTGSLLFDRPLNGTSASFTGNVETSGIIFTDVLQNYTGGVTPLTIKTGGGQSLILQTNSTDRLTLASTGAATFSSSVTIEGANSTIRSGNELRFNRADNAIYTSLNDAGNGASNGFILNNTNGEGFHFKNGATTIMRLNSANNVGIGTASPINQLDINNISTTFWNVGFNAVLNGGDSELRYISTGQSGGRTGSHVFYTGTTLSGTERMRITSDGYARLSASSGGIQFNGDTAAANALDDYEEGTWTPTVADASSGGNLATLSAESQGVYTKIGRVVYFRFSVVLSSKASMTAGNTLFVRGFPFQSQSIPGNWYRPNATIIRNITFTGYVQFNQGSGSTAGWFRENISNANGDDITVSDLTDSAAMQVSGFYFI
jgi:hypothetical protein